MMLKLQDTESKIVVLKEQVDKLEVHEKELYMMTEALKMQSRIFKFFDAQASISFGKIVPT
jgi:hypothetical protein